MVLLFSFFFCFGGFLVAHADSASVLDWSVNKGDNVKPDDYYSGRSFDFVQHPGVFDATYPLSQTIDFTHPAHVGYTTFKNWFYSTGNSTPYTLRGWIRYYGPDIQVRWSTGSSVGSYSSLSMSSGSQNGGCVYSSSTSDWYDRIKVTIQPTFILPDQDYYLTVAGNAVGSFLSPVADDSAFVFKQLSQVKYSDTQFICTYSVRNTSTETKKLTSVEFSTSSSGGFTLSSFTVSPYSSSSEDVIAAIEKQTGELDQSITDAGQGVQDKIESQYDTSQGSEVGSAAQGFADQAAESLGVVSYVDTLFSGLSGLVTAGSTTLTFPAFAIAVQGTNYQVWQEHTFDLSQLDGWFSGLMAAVRLATSVVVVGAVIHYLQSVYKDVIG